MLRHLQYNSIRCGVVMTTTIIVHFVARSHHVICKLYIPLVYIVFFVLTQRIGNRKTNLPNNCVRVSLQKKIVKFFSFILSDNFNDFCFHLRSHPYFAVVRFPSRSIVALLQRQKAATNSLEHQIFV
jgi:hypothetical protein